MCFVILIIVLHKIFQRGDLTPYDVNLAEMLAACNEEVFQVFKANISKKIY